MKKLLVGMLLLLMSVVMLYASPKLKADSKNSEKNELYQEVHETNALKGFVPFSGNYTVKSAIPASMEFFYIPLNKILIAKDTYDFTALEESINKIAARGNQAIFRIYIDYPKKVNGTPDFFWDMGINKINYKGEGNNGYFPDYTDQRCMDLICDCIQELGKKYDGDPRIAYIFAGFIGHWGEWHNYYYTLTPGHQGEKLPDEKQKAAFVKTFAEAFKITPILARTPFSPAFKDYPKFGFHDDSFTQATIDASKDWNFMYQLKKNNMTERWKSGVIGGEFRPEHQLPFMFNRKMPSGYQDYEKCVKETHCSWLLYDEAFTAGRSTTRETLWEANKKLGYDLYCSKMDVSLHEKEISLLLTISNVGIAPVYYNWKPELSLVKDGNIMYTWISPFENWDLPAILPSSSSDYSASLVLPDNISSEKLSGCKLVLGIPNPMNKGVPLKLSNKSLNQDYPGYITIAAF